MNMNRHEVVKEWILIFMREILGYNFELKLKLEGRKLMQCKENISIILTCLNSLYYLIQALYRNYFLEIV